MKSDLKKLNALSVRLHGKRIGIITRLAGDRQLFASEQDYIDDEKRPTLSLSFKGSTGGLVTQTRPTGRRVPPFFSNLLPEGHLREYLAKRADVNSEREFFLLAVLGADLPGALVVAPLEPHERQGDAHHDDDEQHEDDQAHRGEGPLRFSLAGVQLKFSAVMETSGGLTIPADGIGGSWIVKLPSARYKAVPENEFTMLELARRVGISVPDNKLVDIASIEGLPEQAHTAEGKALAVKRFDRLPNGDAVHMEDFAQVFGQFPNDKYEHRSYANIAAVLWAESSEESTWEFVRRLVFSVLIGNADMHLKNWSLIYPDRGTPVLSPGYDFVATLPYLPHDKLGLSFGDSKSLSEITPDQMRRFADTARIPTSPLWQIAAETAERTVAEWKTLEQKDLLQKDMGASIEKQIHAVAATVTGTVRA
jgi:serine/threonine-protein kinase HipA